MKTKSKTICFNWSLLTVVTYAYWLRQRIFSVGRNHSPFSHSEQQTSPSPPCCAMRSSKTSRCSIICFWSKWTSPSPWSCLSGVSSTALFRSWHFKTERRVKRVLASLFWHHRSLHFSRFARSPSSSGSSCLIRTMHPQVDRPSTGDVFPSILKLFRYLDAWLNARVAIERAIAVSKGVNFDKQRSKRITRCLILLYHSLFELGPKLQYRHSLLSFR